VWRYGSSLVSYRLVVAAIGFVVGFFGSIVVLSIPLGVLSDYWQSEWIGFAFVFYALIVVGGVFTARVFWRITGRSTDSDQADSAASKEPA
jgi:hypothetical protein